MASDSAVHNYYDQYWSEEGFSPEGPMDPLIWSAFERHMSPDAAVADIGCGDGGTYGRWIAARCRGYRGFDVSTSAVERARSRGLEVELIDDAAAIPVEDGSFDVVVCNEVLEHLFDPLGAAREALRILRPGGVLICTVPNLGFWRRRADLLVGRWNPLGDDRSVAEPWRDPHVRFFTLRTLQAMLDQAGFTAVEVQGHSGAALRELPVVRRLRRGDRGSRAYLRAQRQVPSLLGHGLLAVARRPS